jgi:hypothetical protein
VPRGTLVRYVKDTSCFPKELINVHLGRRTIVCSELENKLTEHCIIMDQRYYGLRRQDIKHMAFQLAKRNGFKHPFNQETSTCGKKWLRSFLERHPVLYMRTPEGISESNESELRKVNHPAHRIFSVETGITTV